MSNVILVDLDNLYIINDKINIPILLKRKEMIENVSHSKIIWFCNKVTSKLMKDEKIIFKNLKISNVKNDSADHNLMNYLEKHKNTKKFTVVTNDKTLMRVLYFIHKSKNIEFLSFKGKKIEKITNKINICFEKQIDLEKFLTSYNLYKSRYVL
jgi:rRNA-processing protein FCF1